MARLIWDKLRRNPTKAVSDQLGIERWQLREAIHKIKAANNLGATDRVFIYDDGQSRTKRVSVLATSTARSDQSDSIKAFATLRFAGDRLDPDQISQILHIQPTKAVKKGDEHGRSGIWYLSTDKLIPGNELMDHVGFLLSLLLPVPGDVHRLITLRDLVRRRNIQSHVTCFWHGKSSVRKPTIPQVVPKLFDLIPADLQTDFDSEE